MANTFKKIQTVTVGSGGAATIDFQNIPATYTDLVILTSLRSDRASQIGSSAGVSFNNTTANRTMRDILGDGSNVSSGNDTQFYVRIPASTSTASVFGDAIIYIPNYTSANNKSLLLDSVTENNATGNFMELMAGLWSNTSAINRVTLTENNSANFVQYSTATLYGVSDVTAASNAYATGGIITYDDTYVYHTFPWSGTFTPTRSLNVDYLVVAGGGGGGYRSGGGGGAGGLRCTVGATGGGGSLESQLAVTAQAYTVTVGAGGSGSAGGNGSAGSNSVFSTITSTGGGFGGGAHGSNVNGGSGGSGGGPSGTGSAGTGTANQGFNSGTGDGVARTYYGGGGGGAGAVGNSSTYAGGNGVATSISGTSTTYAGGGGGGYGNDDGTAGSGGTGGSGGGGAGGGCVNSSTSTAGTAGTANTGGGGGGGGYSGGSNNSGAAGGSGIVIVRYAR